MDMAQNILVIKTVAGMASAVCAALDAMKWNEIVGSIAGDDTIMCAIRTVEDTAVVGSACAVDAVDVSTRFDELSPSTDEPGFDEEASGAVTSSACAV